LSPKNFAELASTGGFPVEVATLGSRLPVYREFRPSGGHAGQAFGNSLNQRSTMPGDGSRLVESEVLGTLLMRPPRQI
jgi:hypothetical protein